MNGRTNGRALTRNLQAYSWCGVFTAELANVTMTQKSSQLGHQRDSRTGWRGQ